MIRSRPLLATSLALAACAFAARPAQAAPKKVANVLELGADFDDMPLAQALTSLLRLQVGDGGDFSLASDGPNLLVIAPAVRCDTRGFAAPPFGPEADQEIDPRCLRSIGAHLGAKNYFWGYVYHDSGGRPGVKLHLWSADDGDRSKALMLEGGGRERLASRLYEHLVHPGRAADVRLSGAGLPAGDAELFVDGAPAGRYAAGDEVTVKAGERRFELRRAGKAVAEAKATVSAGRPNEVRLEPAGAIANKAPEPLRAPPQAATPPRRAPSSWKRPAGFAALGVGAAGVVGAGAFFLLRRGEENDLKDLCRGQSFCPDEARSSVDRSNRWGTLSIASLGAGVVGLGVGTFLLATSSSPGTRPSNAATTRVGIGASPLAGGALTTFTFGL